MIDTYSIQNFATGGLIIIDDLEYNSERQSRR